MSQGVREIRDFYQLGADTLWITFADRHLYWAFAEPDVIAVAGQNRAAGVVSAAVSEAGVA